MGKRRENKKHGLFGSANERKPDVEEVFSKEVRSKIYELIKRLQPSVDEEELQRRCRQLFQEEREILISACRDIPGVAALSTEVLSQEIDRFLEGKRVMVQRRLHPKSWGEHVSVFLEYCFNRLISESKGASKWRPGHKKWGKRTSGKGRAQGGSKDIEQQEEVSLDEPTTMFVDKGDKVVACTKGLEPV